MAFRNPFASREPKVDPMRADMQIQEAPEYVVPAHGAYSVPPLSDGAPYIKTQGWSPVLRTSTTEIPSAQRLRTVPRRDFRPDPVRPPEEFYDPMSADIARRHSVEDIDANGWTVRAGISHTDRRWAPNPRSTPPPEPRLTSRLGPRTYAFTRPFDQGAARQFNGTHFSMADHRRNYEILGMAPVRTMRNTYRLVPEPWDVDIVDMPPESNPSPEARLRGTELPAPRRSWRL